jgi:CHAD domain-containing protein
MGLHTRLHDLVIRHSHELLRHVPGVRNGDADAIHDARVATRRIRAVLAVLRSDHDNHDTFAVEMRRWGRALGEARDLDIVVGLFEEKVWQLPEAARAAIAFSQAAVRERTDARRALIKVIEGSPLRDLAPTATRRVPRWWTRTSASVEQNLRTRMHEQSAKLTAAVDHASGVYFPNRTHDVRIQVKRLRYVVEVAAQAGRSQTDRAQLSLLKRVQTVLGNRHDRELLIQRLAQSGEHGVEIEALRARLMSERDGLFQDYLSRRDQLCHVAESIRTRTADRGRNWVPLVAILAVPSALVIRLARRRNVRASQYQQLAARPLGHTPRPAPSSPAVTHGSEARHGRPSSRGRYGPRLQ